jgi:hypothetical protein
MGLSTLTVTRTINSPEFWSKKVKKIIVVIASTSWESIDCLIAYGVNPDTIVDSPPFPDFVFERLLPVDGLGEFLKELVDGPPAGYMPDQDWNAWADGINTAVQVDYDINYNVIPYNDVIADSVDISTTVPKPPGPNAAVVFALADAVNTVESLAALSQQAVVTPPAERQSA